MIYEIPGAGVNTVAVVATNADQGSAGLAARVTSNSREIPRGVLERRDLEDGLKEFPHRQKARFDDSRWLSASWALGATLPWATKWRRPAPTDGSK